MEANHPLFLPRLVPHVFDIRQPRTKSKMSMPRSVSPISTTEDKHTTSTPPSHSNTPMSTSEGQGTTPTQTQTPTFNHNAANTLHNTSNTLSMMKILFDGNPDNAIQVLRHCQRVNPRVVVSTLAALGSGGKEEWHDILGIL